MDTTTDLAEHSSSEAGGFRLLVFLTAIWAIFYVPYWLTWNWIAETVALLAALAGLVGALFWIVSAAFYRSKRMLVIGIVIAALSGFVLSRFGEVFKAHATLDINRAKFLAIAEKALKAPAKWEAAGRVNGATVDTNGGGVRVAFDLGAGFLDDHKSIVYDPEGAVTQQRTPGENDHLPFEGYYSTVMHLDGPWYFVNLNPDVPVDGR